MRSFLVSTAAGIASLAVCAGVCAEPLARSGTIAYHTGWKFSGGVLNVADKHVQGHGTVSGVTFNDKGSGPLHQGPANCFDVFFLIEGRGKNKGFCAFGDPDGDRIFTEFTGMLVPEGGGSGTNEIVGGTGKYSGIQGSGPWKCKPAGAGGELHCNQRLDYRLP